jgi:hypothetical protein
VIVFSASPPTTSPLYPYQSSTSFDCVGVGAAAGRRGFGLG